MTPTQLRMAMAALQISPFGIEEATGIDHTHIAHYAYFNSQAIDMEKIEKYFKDRSIYFGTDYVTYEEDE